MDRHFAEACFEHVKLRAGDIHLGHQFETTLPEANFGEPNGQ